MTTSETNPTTADATRGSGMTRGVRSGLESDTQFGAVVPPLHLSSNFTFADFAEPRKYDYTRSGNPTRDLLGEALAELEGGAGGAVGAVGPGEILTVEGLQPLGDLRPGGPVGSLGTAGTVR